MSRASRGRGRGQGRGARGRRDAGGPGFTYNTKRLLIDRADSMSDTSSLGEVSLTSLCKVDISKESTFMKVAIHCALHAAYISCIVWCVPL